MRLRWTRAVGDTLFAAGCVSLVAFVVGLATGHSYEAETSRVQAAPSEHSYTPARG